MDTNQINRIQIHEFLYSQGYVPIRVMNDRCWYHSPLRQELSPLFRVDLNSNRWFDPILGKGGTTLELLKMYFKTEDIGNIYSYIACLAPRFLWQHPATIPQIVIEGIFPNLADDCIARIHERGIVNPCLIEKYIKGVSLRKVCEEQSRHGIGFRNDSGGFEILAHESQEHVGPDDTTLIKGFGETCVVFGTFLDFLSFKTMVPEKFPEAMDADCLVFNSTTLIKKSIPVLRNYSSVTAMFSNDYVGKLVTGTLMESLGGILIDQSAEYNGFKTLNDFLLSRMSRVEESRGEIRARMKLS